jgi:hypothetical protein
VIERDFDVPFIAELALREKQIQQNYRPVISVHKWFARRPGTLFRGLLLAEFGSQPLRAAFYESNCLDGVRVADPFMGGGTPLIEANRLGCDVIGYDINPMAYWVVKQELEHIDLAEYARAAGELRGSLEREIGELYRTRCEECGSEEARVKYFLWVKTATCPDCGNEVRLFPGYLIAKDRRHPRNVLLCANCASLNEVADRAKPGECTRCGASLDCAGPAGRNRCECGACGRTIHYPAACDRPPRHQLFAIEYHCFHCKPSHRGRFFKAPDEQDLRRARVADERLSQMATRFVPDDAIPEGDETGRLLRWGYRHYREMFNSRQLLGLELSCRLIHSEPEVRIRHALATNLSDLLRYQNMLCRYDTMALKSLDIFSVHGFPVGLIQCESNLLGTEGPNGNTNIGSGGWSNIISKFLAAKQYCEHPFEVRRNGRRSRRVPIRGEWIGDSRNGGDPETRVVRIAREDAAQHRLRPDSLDGVFTDPPYFGNVQYAELMDFCYVWLRQLVGDSVEAFGSPTTRDPAELTGNESMGRTVDDFAEGLSDAFRKSAKALRRGAPLVFTYHHNELEAYYPVAVAILDAELVCSASLPCPAEMGASIHISGTGSSIVDTVFVCRATGSVPRPWLAGSPADVARLVRADLKALGQAGLAATTGDIVCIIYGHLIRLAVWDLRHTWSASGPMSVRMARVAEWIARFGGPDEVACFVQDLLGEAPSRRGSGVSETDPEYQLEDDEIAFLGWPRRAANGPGLIRGRGVLLPAL